MGVVTKEVIGLIPGLRLVTPITLIGLPIVTGNHSNVLTPPTFTVFIGHLIEIGGGTHNQKAVQDHIHREGSHQSRINALFYFYLFIYFRRKERGRDYSYSPSPERRRSSKKCEKDKKHKVPLCLSLVSPPPHKSKWN